MPEIDPAAVQGAGHDEKRPDILKFREICREELVDAESDQPKVDQTPDGERIACRRYRRRIFIRDLGWRYAIYASCRGEPVKSDRPYGRERH